MKPKQSTGITTIVILLTLSSWVASTTKMQTLWSNRYGDQSYFSGVNPIQDSKNHDSIDNDQDYNVITQYVKKARSSLLQNDLVNKALHNNGIKKKSEKDISSEINPFKILNLYERMPIKFMRGVFNMHQSLGIAEDKSYCDTVDMLNLQDSSNWLSDNWFTCDSDNQFLTSYLAKIMNDANPLAHDIPYRKLINSKEGRKIKKSELGKNITVFVMQRTDFAYHLDLKVDHLCVTQAVGFIPGLENIGQKTYFPVYLKNYADKYKDRPQCFQSEDIFPTTYVMSNQRDCKEFFNLLNSREYIMKKKDNPFQYLTKIGKGSHKGQGIELLTSDKELELIKTYDHGELCGFTQDNYLIVQKYMPNPLLLKGTNKFDFRVYVLVASTNPLIVFYRDGLIRVSLKNYDIKSTDIKVHLTNSYISDTILKNITNEEEHKATRQFQLQYFPDFQKLLLDTGVIDDPHWVDNFLRPQLRKKIAHIIRTASDTFMVDSALFRMCGFDFMMDDKMNLYFIESNQRPAINEDEAMRQFTESKIGDMLDIVLALLRSRLTRIQSFMTSFIKDHLIDMVPYDHEEKVEEFRRISKNKFDPDFPIRENNSWWPVIDMNREGADAYFGLISEECI